MTWQGPRERTLVVILAAVAIGFVLSDVLIASFAGFWRDHAMASSIVSGVFLVLFTALVIDQLLEFREAQQWRESGRSAAADITKAAIDFLEAVQAGSFSVYLQPEEGADPFAFQADVFHSAMSHAGVEPFVAAADELEDAHQMLLGRLNRWSPLLVSHSSLHGLYQATNELEHNVADFVEGIGVIPGHEEAQSFFPETEGVASTNLLEYAGNRLIAIVESGERLDEESEALGGRSQFQEYRAHAKASTWYY